MKTPSQPKTIFVIDDDPGVRDALKRFLEAQGHRVSLASNGKEGLDSLEAGNRPDWVLLDQNMPEMDGASFLTQVRSDARFSGLKVIALSGDCDSKPLRLADVILEKPIDPAGLLKAIA